VFRPKVDPQRLVQVPEERNGVNGGGKAHEVVVTVRLVGGVAKRSGSGLDEGTAWEKMLSRVNVVVWEMGVVGYVGSMNSSEWGWVLMVVGCHSYC